MDGSTAVLAIKALDMLGRRAEVTAENLANAGTPGYRPLHLSFEDALKVAATEGDAAVRQLQPTVERSVTGTGNGEMRADLEMATASATAGRYAALVDVLTRQLQIEALAITGNG
ncbi:MAG: hypothetical protein WDN01_14285 [Rhizomicrobium sp.]